MTQTLTTTPVRMRLGLCCQFVDEPIRFRTTTATACLRLPRRDRLAKLADLCRVNAAALAEAIRYCAPHDIGCFRINSQVLPVKTHPEAGYEMDDLPDGDAVVAAYRECGALARQQDVRLSLHPDQYVVLNSPRDDVTAKSLAEIESQAELASWVGADVVNVHGGGAYGDKPRALDRLIRQAERLSPQARRVLTFENDDTTYTPADLLPVCRALNVPLVYDVHHHRCLPDELDIAAATDLAAATWDREPMVHLSSPKEGWDGPAPHRHHDDIDVADVPDCWFDRTLTVEVEAKGKERAIARLQRDLAARRRAC